MVYYYSPYDDDGIYFTVAYILMAVVIVSQVFYYCFVVISYRSIKKRIIEKGRLIQIIPIISIATVTQAQIIPDVQASASAPPPSYNDATKIDNKQVPPPYAP